MRRYMPQDYEREDLPHIRISRNGSVTRFAESGAAGSTPRAAAGAPRYFEDEAPLDERRREPTEAGHPESSSRQSSSRESTSRERPMPRRLSEEARETVDLQRRTRVEAEEEPVVKTSRKRATKKTKSAEQQASEQIPLPLKAPRSKPDAMVRQRQVLGFSCVVMAVLVLLAIISYSSDDASRAETKISDLPSLFLPHGNTPDPIREAVRASADQAKNWLGLIGAMLANFLINKTIGFAAILYPIFFGAWSLAFFRFTYKQRRRLTLATTFFLLTAVLFSATMGTVANFASIPREWSGSVGQFLGLAFTRAIGGAGAFIIYAAAFIIMLIFSIDLDIEKTFHRLHGWWNALVLWSRRKIIEFWEKREARQILKEERRAAEEALERESLESPEEDETHETILADGTNKAEEKGPATFENVEEEITPVIRSAGLVSPMELPTTGMKMPAVVAVVAPATPSDPSPLSSPTILPGQPLLKVRPAQKHERTAIPRLTRNAEERLGARSMHFSRLTNGAVEQEQKSSNPPAPSTPTVEASLVEAPLPALAPIDSNIAVSEAAISAHSASMASIDGPLESLENIDTSEELIEPLKRHVRSSKNTMPPVMVGDEKVLANEALPHSISVDTGLPIPEAIESRGLLRDADSPAEDLFFEEGKKPVVPENPYLEMLSKYRNPTVDLLTPADPKDALDANDEELAKKGRLLRDKLATFGVEIENITVTPGPVVTLYEFTPAEGVKVSRVENLTDDIALAMKARGIRIIAPIPGRGTIGVEIPNDVAKIVRIREMFESASFKNTKMNLPLALGKTISGDVYIDDLNKMPHLLIAGATGSGKSVGVNGIIASLLYAKSPRDVKFVIVDPKKIELSLYKKLRKHYLIVSPEAGEDIVTTPAYAVLALKAVEIEMERRYDKLAKAAVRSLADYNIKVAQGKLRSTQEEQHYHLPYIVVIIDELADLMITAAREIEEPICRIAQMARAVGIHMILATQRPSVDVITGVIKANFPARMAFQVATRVDSRTILDSMGAEQLMGNGDMLYQPSGTPKPIRLQSPFISTEEVEAMIDAIAMQDGDKLSYSRPWTLPSLREKESPGGYEIEEEDSRDELFEEAAKTVVRHQQGSVSLLQRRLKIGYSRAARVMDELEMAAIVGAFDGSKARQVLCENEAELEVVLEGLR